MGIIFDLDQTLVDTKPVKKLRENRQWKMIYPKVNFLKPYTGVLTLLEKLNDNNIPIVIVTNSPRTYAECIVSHWGFKVKGMVCYHDVVNRKPHAEPMLKAIRILNTENYKIISIGDDYKDIISAKNANIVSVAALWDSSDPIHLIRESNPDYVCNTVEDLTKLLINKLNLF